MKETEIRNDSFLSVRDLVVQFTSEGETVHAVNGVSFDLKRGQTIGLVGETGAGKTTIAKAILRILPARSSKVANGEIFLEGRDLLQVPEEEMRAVRGQKIAMIFQDPMSALNPVMRIGKQISEVILTHNNINKKEAETRAKAILEMVGIPASRFREYPHQFSGGMKQRVVIAMALACDPDLLIADEPTTALDVTIQAQILDMINELKTQKNTSMIMITHDMGIVAEVCDDVAVVYAGEIIEFGSKEELFDHPTHPYTKGLFGAIPKLDGDEERLSPVDGLPPDPTDLPQGCSFSPRCPYATEACKAAPVELQSLGGTHMCRCIRKEGK